ncbi:MAG: hypothetical protein ACYTF0_00605, partial [Planctomycetota bacterium]
SDSFGNLEEVVERFAEAYCLSVDGHAFGVESVRLCMFDPEALVVGFDTDDAGCPDPNDAMETRFTFAFISQMEDEPDALDPWLVVRPCTRDQAAVWYDLMDLSGPQQVQVFCLDAQLRARLANES